MTDEQLAADLTRLAAGMKQIRGQVAQLREDVRPLVALRNAVGEVLPILGSLGVHPGPLRKAYEDAMAIRQLRPDTPEEGP